MLSKHKREQIRSIARERGVFALLHFTQEANLAGIMERGILSRGDLEGFGHRAYYSDAGRLDRNDGAVSVSVSRVNLRMFAKKRRESGHRNWVVLVLWPDILWTFDCDFCWRNAARSDIAEHRGFRGGPWAFRRMFEGGDEARSGLEPYHPTDPQAEVQVLQPIPPDKIRGAVVDRPEISERVSKRIGGLTVIVDHAFF